MSWAGHLFVTVGILIIVVTYLVTLFQYIFAQYIIPFPVRLTLPVLALGIVLTLLSLFWERLKRARGERF